MSKITILFALIGFSVVVLWAAGTLGIGHFLFFYGPQEYQCPVPTVTTTQPSDTVVY